MPETYNLGKIKKALLKTIVNWSFFSGPIEGSSITVQKGNKLKTVPIWGPTYSLSFQLKIKSWDGSKKRYILHSTGYPIVTLAKGTTDSITVSMVIDKQIMHHHIDKLKANTWYKIVIAQIKVSKVNLLIATNQRKITFSKC